MSTRIGNYGAHPDGARTPAGADYSRFVQRIRRRYVGELNLLAAGLPGSADLGACFLLLRERFEPGAALRVLRQLVVERLAVLDCEHAAPMPDVTACVTRLAEFTLEVACAQVQADLDAIHGEPLTPAGQRSALWVVGMGKLGARELNVSSDIDLIYVYEEDGETRGLPSGRGRISNHEYFAKAVRGIYALIGDTTEHGFVFRVDLALRPNGNSGPPCVSLDALEQYFLVQGREWERFAWLKSRVVVPGAAVQSGSAAALRAVVSPFVFRRYLDYGVFESLRDLHRQIREQANKRSAGRPGHGHDVKLSRGGIREIEFIVQLLQVVRGGQFPELRTRPTLRALERVSRAGLMPTESADGLARAYDFLRRVEHRIQYLDDQQTHALPSADADVEWIARTMGFDGACPFLAQLDTHRERVAQEFDALLGGAKDDCKTCNGQSRAPSNADIAQTIAGLQGPLRERLEHWQTHPRVLALRDEGRVRLMRLVQRSAQWLAEGRVSEQAALRLADWIEPLLRRESYLAMLVERPAVHERLMRILGAARWPARYLLQHPGVIDELAGAALLAERFDANDFEGELEQRRSALARNGEDDDESLLNLLRRGLHAEIFRTLARDVEGALTVEQVADELSALADCVLRVTSRWCWERLRNRHRDTPLFAILGYGKLGGKELGYGSDLDIVFVYDDEDDRAAEVYGAFVRKLINWLTTKTSEGDMYEIDTALRPNGNSGLLVSTMDAFARYQLGRGSNTAWTWEHQAMTRARFVMGTPDLAERFEAVRRAVIASERGQAELRGEIASMRDKLRRARTAPPGRFDVKHSAGGMVDIEFCVQLLVLGHARAHPELADNVGNIALLLRAEVADLLPEGVGQAAADAYRDLRRWQHRARLNEDPTHVDPEQLSEQARAIRALWAHLFGSGAPNPANELGG